MKKAVFCLHCSKPFEENESRYDSYGVRDSLCFECFDKLNRGGNRNNGKINKRKLFNLKPLTGVRFIKP